MVHVERERTSERERESEGGSVRERERVRVCVCLRDTWRERVCERESAPASRPGTECVQSGAERKSGEKESERKRENERERDRQREMCVSRWHCHHPLLLRHLI